MSAPFSMPKATSGRIILIAQITVKEGRADEALELMRTLRKDSYSDKEPNTHTYRTTRSEENPNKFLFFEEYTLPDGIKEHTSGEAFQALGKAGVVEDLDIKYYNEFE